MLQMLKRTIGTKFRTEKFGQYKKLYYLCIVKHKELIIMQKEVTEQENELIEAIRNYRRAYPNGEKNLRKYARKMFQILMND